LNLRGEFGLRSDPTLSSDLAYNKLYQVAILYINRKRLWNLNIYQLILPSLSIVIFLVMPITSLPTMEIVAVSTSTPSWHIIDGTKTLTSIIHKASPSITLTASGINGNKTAAHNAPVYIFFEHHYDYWTSKLGIQRSSWGACHWGENITFRCSSPALNEYDFCLGDVWNVGENVRLQVCGARVPCSRLAWRCGQGGRWLKELADSGLCGVYMRVLEGGVLRPGDRAGLVEKCEGSMNCATISKLAFDSDVKTKDVLNLLLEDPNLLSMNRGLFERKLSMIVDKSLLNKNSWRGWRTFRPFKIVEEGDDVKSFYLKPIDGKPIATYLPGQFLTLRLPTGLVRNWSISDWVGQDCPAYYRISIKKSTNASLWMHENCNLETNLELRSPAGAFHLDWTPMFPNRQVYISAGIGVTPILAMLKAHFSHPAMRKAPALWIHVCRDDGAYTSLLDEVPRVDGLERRIFFTKARQEDVLGDKYHHAGRPTLEVTKELIGPSYFVNPLDITPVEIPGIHSTLYICGPKLFKDDMKTKLRELGVSEGSIHSETFSSDSTPQPILQNGAIRFSKSKRSVKWNSEDGASLSILEIAEQAGLEPEYGCRVGSCGSCRVNLLKGSVVGGMQPDGSVRICCAKPASESIEIEL
jgi:ferredoxin-NADP reductase/MOSC domain-containing protein YiiM